MASKKISQRKAREMEKLLLQIHAGLKDKNRNKTFQETPFIEIAWMISIEKQLCIKRNK